MKIRGYSFKCEHLFYVYLRKHYCPLCRNKLLRKKISQIRYSDPSIPEYDTFDMDDISVKGFIKISHIEFFCPTCQKHYTVKEAKEQSF